MRLAHLLASVALLAISGPAAAVTMTTNISATSGAGTPIFIGGSATPQYSFFLGTFFNGAAQYQIRGNDGATVAFPDNGVPQLNLSAVTTRLENITFTEGDYRLNFSIGSAAFTGFATVVDEGRRISAISFDPVATAPIPEPATWAMLALGFGLLGTALRHRRPALA